MKKKYIKPSTSEYEVSPMSIICASQFEKDDNPIDIPVDNDHTLDPGDSL